MEDKNQRNYSQESDNPQNEQEKHIETARLNVDSERKWENLKDDTDPNRYYNNDTDDAASTSGKESSYSSPEDERAYDPGNIEKYITHENPDADEESDSNGVSSPNRTPGI